MLLSKSRPTLLSLLTILLTSTHQTSATPYHRDAPESLEAAILVDRSCPVPCGWQGQLCCAENQRCYTDSAGQAQCGALQADAQTVSAAQGTWQYYTTTWVETDLITRSSVYSSYIPGPTATGINCNFALLELPCGNICCQAGQICQVLGQCAASGSGSSAFYSSNYGTYSVPLRPTTGGPTTLTSYAVPTATVPFLAPIGSAGGIVYGAATVNHGLSGGAIAGIVIGVLAGIIFLALICFYCCLRASFDRVLAIFGIGPRRRTSETIIEEHHHASGGAGWFGRPSAAVTAERPSRTSSWGGIAAALAALAVMLGLRRRHSSYGSKSSYDTYTTTSYDTSEMLVLVDEAHVAMGLGVIIRKGRNEMKKVYRSDGFSNTGRSELGQEQKSGWIVHVITDDPPIFQRHPFHLNNTLSVTNHLHGHQKTSKQKMPLIRPPIQRAPLAIVRQRQSLLTTPPSTAVTIAQSRSVSASSPDHHEDRFDPPGGWLFGVPPGEKYKKEGWESIWIYGFFGSFALAAVAYAFKPDTSIQTWALEEARRRLEAEGILKEPEEK